MPYILPPQPITSVEPVGAPMANDGFGSIATRATERHVRPRQLYRRKPEAEHKPLRHRPMRVDGAARWCRRLRTANYPPARAAQLPIAPSPYPSGLLARRCGSRGITGAPALAGLQEFLRPAVIHRGGYAFALAQFGNVLLAAQTASPPPLSSETSTVTLRISIPQR